MRSTSVLSRRLRLSINPGLINKNEAKSDSLFKSGWVNSALTPAELAEEINKGVAYCCELSGPRNAAKFVCSDVISVDIDGTRRINEALADPIAQKYLTIFYTTHSHTENEHRFRLLFALDRTLDNARDMIAATRSLSLRMSGDRSATDAARIFYGSKGSNPEVFDRAIDDEFLNELIAQGLNADRTDSIANNLLATTVSNQKISLDQVVRNKFGQLVQFSTLTTGVTIHCPYHHDTNASAFTVKSSYSETIGIHCSTCRQTFWPMSLSNNYNFFDFDKRVREADEYFRKNKHMGSFQEILTAEGRPAHEGLIRSNVTLAQTDYLLLPSKLPVGTIFIKSPKGTGKTEQLANTLEQQSDTVPLIGDRIRDQPGGSTLLIGHRQALIRQSCQRLGLECYLDFKGRPLKRKRLGVCLDSIHRLRWPERSFTGQTTTKENIFQTVIIDESEQVLSHFLSDTIDPIMREKLFIIFRTLLRRARRVIALDADLGWLSFETLSKLAQSTDTADFRESHIILNDRPDSTPVYMFDSSDQLIGDLQESIADGKRVFVTSNSKALVESLYEGIADRFGESIKAIAITSETNRTDEVKAFISNPSQRALDYRVILTSPSLGTGVDITF
jgi:hypothetical protein